MPVKRKSDNTIDFSYKKDYNRIENQKNGGFLFWLLIGRNIVRT